MKPDNLYEQKTIAKSIAKLTTNLEKLYSASRALEGHSTPSLDANLAIIDARAKISLATLKLEAARRTLEA